MSRMEVHLRTHTGFKPYKCQFENCDKRFNEKGNLITHMRIHTQEKPFVCTFESCNMQFKAHGHLKDHIKKHYNLKPYICMICNIRFSRNSTLKMHQKTHTEIKPYHCYIDYCNKKFIDKSQIKFHLKSVHFHDEHDFEDIFNNYLETYKDRINNLLDEQGNELKKKSMNIKNKPPELPKYIKVGNTYNINISNYNQNVNIIDNPQKGKEKIKENDTLNNKFLSFDTLLKNKRGLRTDQSINTNTINNIDNSNKSSTFHLAFNAAKEFSKQLDMVNDSNLKMTLKSNFSYISKFIDEYKLHEDSSFSNFSLSNKGNLFKDNQNSYSFLDEKKLSFKDKDNKSKENDKSERNVFYKFSTPTPPTNIEINLNSANNTSQIVNKYINQMSNTTSNGTPNTGANGKTGKTIKTSKTGKSNSIQKNKSESFLEEVKKNTILNMNNQHNLLRKIDQMTNSGGIIVNNNIFNNNNNLLNTCEMMSNNNESKNIYSNYKNGLNFNKTINTNVNANNQNNLISNIVNNHEYKYGFLNTPINNIKFDNHTPSNDNMNLNRTTPNIFLLFGSENNSAINNYSLGNTNFFSMNNNINSQSLANNTGSLFSFNNNNSNKNDENHTSQSNDNMNKVSKSSSQVNSGRNSKKKHSSMNNLNSSLLNSLGFNNSNIENNENGNRNNNFSLSLKELLKINTESSNE